MKKQKIILITILFLCVILSIIIIKNNTNIEKETKIIKQMSESTQVSDLNAQINQLNTSHTEYANSIQMVKKNLATALTNQGVATTENDTFDVMTANIGNVLQARTKDATAKSEDIAKDKTAYVNGKKVIGTYENNISPQPFTMTFYGVQTGNDAKDHYITIPTEALASCGYKKATFVLGSAFNYFVYVYGLSNGNWETLAYTTNAPANNGFPLEVDLTKYSQFKVLNTGNYASDMSITIS